jgi:hypothetical protein
MRDRVRNREKAVKGAARVRAGGERGFARSAFHDSGGMVRRRPFTSNNNRAGHRQLPARLTATARLLLAK